jgi:GNAT superfamily N-acetyltransferase
MTAGTEHAGKQASVRLRPAEPRDESSVRTLMATGGMGVALDWQDAMVAVGDDDIVRGYLRVQRTDKGPHVAPVAVFPHWQGTGVGRALMEDALERFGMLKLVARGEVADCYRKLGYHEIPLSEISGDLGEDCANCPDRATCQPVAFMLVRDDGEEGAGGSD